MAVVWVKGFKCERCGHVWVPRNKDKLPLVCPICRDITIFQYDKRIGHSVCTQCGWHGKVPADVAEHILVEIQLKSELKKLKEDVVSFENILKRKYNILRNLNERVLILEKELKGGKNND